VRDREHLWTAVVWHRLGSPSSRDSKAARCQGGARPPQSKGAFGTGIRRLPFHPGLLYEYPREGAKLWTPAAPLSRMLGKPLEGLPVRGDFMRFKAS
jgi:hypothetical protein